MQAFDSSFNSSRKDLEIFHRLGFLAAVSAFMLIVLGGIVRESGSGLGCGPAGSGVHGWPLCNGGLLPAAATKTIIEYSHRAVAALVTVIVVVMVWWAWRKLRHQGLFFSGTICALLLIVFQAVLGGLTVEHNLNEVLVAAHLGTAMVLLGLLIVLTMASKQTFESLTASRTARRVALVATLLSLATILSGGYMAGTEAEGVAGDKHGGAHMACGQQFPLCNGQIAPLGSGRLIDIHLIHRLLMYLTILAIFVLIYLAIRQRFMYRDLYLVTALLVVQITLGVLNVLLEESGALVVLHLTTAALLWSALVGVSYRVFLERIR